MKRRSQNKKMSRKSFNRRASKTSALNTATPLRGGIRL